MIETNGVREPGKSMQAARHDLDDDDDFPLVAKNAFILDIHILPETEIQFLLYD